MAITRATCIPAGPYRPEQGVQRGSVMDMPVHPGRSADAGMGQRARRQEEWRARTSATILKIPVLPISYGDALPILRR